MAKGNVCKIVAFSLKRSVSHVLMESILKTAPYLNLTAVTKEFAYRTARARSQYVIPIVVLVNNAQLFRKANIVRQTIHQVVVHHAKCAVTGGVYLMQTWNGRIVVITMRMRTVVDVMRWENVWRTLVLRILGHCVALGEAAFRKVLCTLSVRVGAATKRVPSSLPVKEEDAFKRMPFGLLARVVFALETAIL